MTMVSPRLDSQIARKLLSLVSVMAVGLRRFLVHLFTVHTSLWFLRSIPYWWRAHSFIPTVLSPHYDERNRSSERAGICQVSENQETNANKSTNNPGTSRHHSCRFHP